MNMFKSIAIKKLLHSTSFEDLEQFDSYIRSHLKKKLSAPPPLIYWSSTHQKEWIAKYDCLWICTGKEKWHEMYQKFEKEKNIFKAKRTFFS